VHCHRNPSGTIAFLIPFIPEIASGISATATIIVAAILGPPGPLPNSNSIPASDRSVSKNDNGGPKDPKVSVAVPVDRKQTGSYTNTHESGMIYNGKGSRDRSQDSGKRIEQNTGDKHTATEFKPASSSREAFKQESRSMDRSGGPKSSDSHNQIESPGKKYREQDRPK
jgi:hypothetical protein